MTKLDDILTAVGALAETVKAQGEQIAALTGDAPAPAAAEDLSHIQFEQGNDAYAPLRTPDPSNIERRTALAALWAPDSMEGMELLTHGARGLYRKLSRPEDHEGPLLVHHVALAMVQDAMTEDPLEAADMGADLLKLWDDVPAPELGEPHLIAGGAVA